MKPIEELYNKFLQIKSLGWVKSIRKGNASIGDTFEKLVGVPQNDFEIPDYNGIEIKTKRNNSRSYTTLFSATPDGPHFHEVERLKDKYGYPHSNFKKYKVLNNSVYANFLNKIGLNFYFKLKIDRSNRKVFLEIYNKNGELIEDNVFWYFDTLEEKLYRKLKVLAYVNADAKFLNNIEYFKYNKITFYLLKDFDKFITLLEKGIIRVTFKISIYLKGHKLGNICDHGTGFEIKENDLIQLFDLYKMNI